MPPAEWAAPAASADPGEAARGIAGLEATVGWEPDEATADLLPDLVTLVSDAGTHHRPRITRLLARLTDPGWPRSTPVPPECEPGLTALLSDADPLVRRQATRLVACAVRAPERALRARLEVEADPGVRHDLLRALGAHAGRGVEALVGDALDETTWSGSGWLDWESWATPIGQVVRDSGELLAGDPGAVAEFATGVAARGGVQHRLAALGCAMRALGRWRDPAPVELVGRLLDDSAPRVRRWAAVLAAHLGPEAREHADRLAELAGRERGSLREAALWALATQDDPRCLPGLVELLRGDVLSFTPTRGISPLEHAPWPFHIGLTDVLVLLRGHADALLPSTTERLVAAPLGETDGWRLLGVLASWGPAALPALPALVDLLAVPGKHHALVALTIGRMGPGAIGAADALRAVAEPWAVQALWEIGATPLPSLAELTSSRLRPPYSLASFPSHDPAAAVVLREVLATTEDKHRLVAACHALWRITGDADEVTPALARVAALLRDGFHSEGAKALRHLAEIGTADGEVLALARTLADRPDRISRREGWYLFARERIAEDQHVRVSASRLLGEPLPR
ncbi:MULTISPECIES: HEAT repeat domain-containing protein [Actinosynnema]|uniref:HEAT repeat domain-containing protein n=1 Tax=Actinosynnema TaxID=40566 RepID=UPI0020A3490E|nr:HEAT repeat domain-containing protein [Actinosynnema pretiosum]MCP2094849.1 HEAT repeats [Actinosynnema pretiosum]